MALAAGAYWHPYDLPHFIAKRDISEFSEARLTAPVISATEAPEGSEYILRAVYSEDYDLLLSGDWQVIALLEFNEAGFHNSEWQALPLPLFDFGDVYIAMILETQIGADDLVIGQAELCCR